MSNYENNLEAARDAIQMERNSILDNSEDELPEHKRSYYMERMFEAADAKRKQMREDALIESMEARK